MRARLGILLVEDDKGGIAVQLFEKPESLSESFDQFKGRIGDKPARATMLALEWSEPSKLVLSDFRTKELPEKVETPWGWRIGSGPMVKPEDCEEAKKAASEKNPGP
jgi:hypothetical protein